MTSFGMARGGGRWRQQVTDTVDGYLDDVLQKENAPFRTSGRFSVVR